MRPTTKDLAKAAGVSLATVDRVLNGRSGVRQKTVDAVQVAIKKIGFERNQLAATLARKRGYQFGFVVPKMGDEFLDEILKHVREINKISRAEMIEAKAIRIDELDLHKAAKALDRLKSSDLDGVAIMAPETPLIRDAIRRMRDRGIHTVPFIANQEEARAEDFVGIDNRSAGATAGRLMGRFTCNTKGSIIVIAETMQSRDNLDRRLGFDDIINKNFPNLTVLPTLETRGDAQRAQQIVKNVFEANNDPVGVYIIGSEARAPLDAIQSFDHSSNLITIAHERTPTTICALQDGKIDAVVTQDPGHLVRSAVRILRAKCENRTTLASQEKIRIEILLAENL